MRKGDTVRGEEKGTSRESMKEEGQYACERADPVAVLGLIEFH